MAPIPAPVSGLVPRGEEAPEFEPWMASVIVAIALVIIVILDAVNGFHVARFVKNLFLYFIWLPLHDLVHKFFPDKYGRYGLKCAAKNRNSGKFTGEGCPRRVICLPPFDEEPDVDYAHLVPLPPSPTDVPLPESPVDAEPPRGRSRTRSPATGSRSVVCSPSPNPDPRIRPRRENSLFAEMIETGLDGFRVAGYHAKLEADVIDKKAALVCTAAKDAACVAEQMHLKAKNAGASEEVLAETRALRQLAADQISWSCREYGVVTAETYLMTLRRSPVRPQQFNEVRRRYREERRVYAQELRAAAAVARAPLDAA